MAEFEDGYYWVVMCEDVGWEVFSRTTLYPLSSAPPRVVWDTSGVVMIPESEFAPLLGPVRIYPPRAAA